MRKNTLKEKLNAGKATLGPFVGFPSPSIVETMGWLGFDFVIIDCEHGPIDYETAENMIRAAELSNTTAIVRIGLNEQQNIQRYMDAGAHGVLIPLVNTAEDAQKVVDSVKYPPIGKRGAYSGRGAQFGAGTGPDYFAKANEETFVAVQIETPEAIENAEEIVATPHVDAVFLGPGDLSLNFGIPGQMEHEKVVSTIESLVEKIKAAGKHPGTLGNHPAHAKFWHDRGVNWLVSATTRYLIAGASTYRDGTHEALGIK